MSTFAYQPGEISSESLRRGARTMPDLRDEHDVELAAIHLRMGTSPCGTAAIEFGGVFFMPTDGHELVTTTAR